MSGQKPMAFRMQEMLESLWKYKDGYRVDRLDKRVLKRLIKQGKVKIVNGTGRAMIINGCKRVMASHSKAVATELPPIKEEVDTGGPYAKRRAAMEESGLAYKGKNWGKVRLDLPREEREKKLRERDLMWKKLKSWRT